MKVCALLPFSLLFLFISHPAGQCGSKQAPYNNLILSFPPATAEANQQENRKKRKAISSRLRTPYNRPVTLVFLHHFSTSSKVICAARLSIDQSTTNRCQSINQSNHSRSSSSKSSGNGSLVHSLWTSALSPPPCPLSSPSPSMMSRLSSRPAFR